MPQPAPATPDTNSNPNPGGAPIDAAPPGGSSQGAPPPMINPGAAPQPAPVPVPPQPAPVERTPTRKLLSGDGDEPDDAELYEISRQNFKRRLERHSKAQLKQLFGTDNPEEIAAWKTQAEEAARREEEQRLAQMSEAERYKAQWQKAQQQYDTMKAEFDAFREQQVIGEQDRRIMGLIGKHIGGGDKASKFVASEFAEHVNTLSEDELRRVDDGYIEQWTTKWVTDNPQFAAAPPQAITTAESAAAAAAMNGANGQIMDVQLNGNSPHIASPPPAPRQIPIPISNGAGGPRPSITQPHELQKTPAPGHPNSMNDTEWREYKRANGLE